VSRRSALMTGRVRHRRHRPRVHELSYGGYHVLLDLDELDELDRTVRGFGHGRRAVTTFHDRDHLDPTDEPVRDKLARWLERGGVALPGGPVLLHTSLRVLGYVFNPVSWFLCHDRDGRLEVIVAEVHNTFGERYCYVLDDLTWTSDRRVEARRTKRFHVSPFLRTAEHTYRFTVRPPALDGPPGERFAVHIAVDDGEGRVLDATVGETREPLTSASLWRALVRYPMVTLVTIAAIHLEAVRLWGKRVPWSRKPAPPTAPPDTAARPLVHAADPDRREPTP
jgi:uncharacterized protein